MDHYDICNKAFLCDPSFDIDSMEWFKNEHHRVNIVRKEDVDVLEEETDDETPALPSEQTESKRSVTELRAGDMDYFLFGSGRTNHCNVQRQTLQTHSLFMGQVAASHGQHVQNINGQTAVYGQNCHGQNVQNYGQMAMAMPMGQKMNMNQQCQWHQTGSGMNMNVRMGSAMEMESHYEMGSNYGMGSHYGMGPGSGVPMGMGMDYGVRMGMNHHGFATNDYGMNPQHRMQHHPM